MLRLKIVHHFQWVKQYLMLCLLAKQIIFTLQCPCNIWSNIAIIIEIHQEVYHSLKEMKFLLIMLIWLLIILNHLNTQQLLQKKPANVKDGNSLVKDTKMVAPLKYLNNFWRSLEMPFINCKVDLELNWIKECILWSTGDCVNLIKQLSEGFKRSVYWNSY